MQSYLDKYGDFKLIIDLHRDSSENKNLIAANLNNQSLAKFMFVLGESSPRFEHVCGGIASDKRCLTLEIRKI